MLGTTKRENSAKSRASPEVDVVVEVPLVAGDFAALRVGHRELQIPPPTALAGDRLGEVGIAPSKDFLHGGLESGLQGRYRQHD